MCKGKGQRELSIRFWRQYVSLFALIAAIVSLLLTSDRKSSRCILPYFFDVYIYHMFLDDLDALFDHTRD